MSDDEMRAEFEAWASERCLSIERFGTNITVFDGFVGQYASLDTHLAWIAWHAAYAAGQKAEREATQLKNWDGVRLGEIYKQEGER